MRWHQFAAAASLLLSAGAIARADTFTVTSTADSGGGSFRAAILAANSQPGLDTITFSISGDTTQTITPSTPLPAILDPVIIDGYTQPGAQPNSAPIDQADNAVIRVVLDGSQAGFGVNGLVLGNDANSPALTSGTLIRGLAIARFEGSGMEVHGGGVAIEGNFIGLDAGGTLARGNNGGVRVKKTGGIAVTIGGTAPAARNVIAANASDNIRIENQASSGTRIFGNFIGTTRSGATARPNSNSGIVIINTSAIVLGAAAAGNVISGHSSDGVFVQDAADIVIQSNIIGCDLSGSSALSNHVNGIEIMGGTRTVVGGAAPGEGNLISASGFGGINIFHAAATRIQGNTIGLTRAGTTARPNANSGIILQDNTSQTLVGGMSPGAGNVISGNSIDGVIVFSSPDNTIQGNRIGTDLSGSTKIGNVFNGVEMQDSDNTVIGGTQAGAGNLISGNGFAGINSFGSHQAIIQGNLVGLVAAGTLALGNVSSGIVLQDGTSGTLVGGSAPGARNIISGNGLHGVTMIAGSDQNVIQGNFIGSTLDGLKALGNGGVGIFLGSAMNIVGGSSDAERNVITSNAAAGVALVSDTSTTNTVQGNFIGLGADGREPLGSTGTQTLYGVGIYLEDALGNHIVANTIGANNHEGLILNGASMHNVVQTNRIGTTADGGGARPNHDDGISIIGTSSNNLIGGMIDDGNLIAYNLGNGVGIAGGSGNRVTGNSIKYNMKLGIDLNDDGPTANDADDSDVGPNALQNYPILTNVSTDGGLTLEGVLNGLPNSIYLIELFLNDDSGTTATVQGQTLLASASHITTPLGVYQFSAFLPGATRPGLRYTATATDSAGNTSEFSPSIVQTAARADWVMYR